MSSTSIIIGGLAGSGTTTVSKMVAAKLGYEHIYAGGIFRSMAAENGMTLEDYMIYLERHPEKERAVDDKLAEWLRRGKVVVESRIVAWLADSKAGYRTIWLTCELGERVRRISQREPNGDAMDRAAERDRRDAARYKEVYGVDQADFSVNELTIDTTTTPAAEVATQILKFVQA